MKINKKLILMLISVLIVGNMGGCSGNNAPKGIENKKFLKDIEKIYDISLKSMSDQKYYEEDINKVLDNMNDEKYRSKLNDYEVSIFELLTETLSKVKEDLTTGKKIVQSRTLNEIKLIREMIDN